MAGLPWFKLYGNIVGHPKTRALEEATGNPEALAYIVRLLSWFNEYAPSGRAPWASRRIIERGCEWRGEPGALIASLDGSGWLERDGEELVLHGWDEAQGGNIAKAQRDAEAKRLQRQAATVDGRPCVYFIRSGLHGPIKIGTARYVERRLAQLQTGHPEPLGVVAVVAGGRRLERQLHDRLAAHRMVGEWFSPSPEVLALVSTFKGES